MKRLANKIQSFQNISAERKMLFLKVIALSLYREILFFIGSQEAYTETIIKEFQGSQISELQRKQAMDIAFAIQTGEKYIPWLNLCRHQAWQAVYLLNQKGIPYTYQVGVKSSNKQEGHAWVKVGDLYVSGICDFKDIFLLRF